MEIRRDTGSRDYWHGNSNDNGFSDELNAILSANNPHSNARFNRRRKIFAEQDYSKIVDALLLNLYPKYCKNPKCKDHKVQLTLPVKNRPYSIRCPKCKTYNRSRFNKTPLHQFKLPYWMFGWALVESLERYPAVLTGAEIQRRLGISKPAAQMLKRRLQILASDQRPKIEKLVHKELSDKYKGVMFTRGKDVDLTDEINALGGSIPQVDTLALFSLSARANGGRKRFRHNGQTSSIYMSDRLGGHQKGTLVHTFALCKKGPVLLDSIPNLQANTVMPLLNKYLPKDTPLFSDEGYKWYYRLNKNHRMINHSARSKDKRYRWSRERWSKGGVNIQVAEGLQGAIKTSFRAYRYFKPEYSQLYLNEYSFWRNIKYYGWGRLFEMADGAGVGEAEIVGVDLHGKPEEQRHAEHDGAKAGMRINASLYLANSCPVCTQA